MLPEHAVWRVARKESALFWASPVAFLFLGVFLAVTGFVFFWGEAFFARNISDVRPLFQWMPLLLIFLASALTMRSWSDERRTGTLEHVLTQPQPLWQFVLGKFLACLGLLLVALLLTLPLPISVSWLGDLDWGPVWAGYAASLLLGAVYLSLGLFVSARSDNAIVALIGSVLLGVLLYLPGSPLITGLFGNDIAQWLRAIGTGARFESIARGVIDLADLYYYLSLTLLFLALNLYTLERDRWAARGDRRHHRGWTLTTVLLVANALLGNVWLGQLHSLRFDVTEGRIHSISDATRRELAQLSEPLLIRGYFSARTHPLLAPLVPQLSDLLQEYAIAGGDQVRVEIVDPATRPELEEEANRRYGIEAVPFQVADRYQAALVNAYFNVLVQYGDEYTTLGFRDLIEVQQRGETDLDVRLRNPEYDLTRAIRKVVQQYQSGGNLFDTVKGTLRFEGYLSPSDRLPPALARFRQTLEEVLAEIAEQGGERFQISLRDPDADGGALARQIEHEYGFMPMTESLLSPQPFYFYLTLHGQDQVVQIPLGDLSREAFKRNLEAGIRRFSSGFTRTLALVTPSTDPMGMAAAPTFYQLEDYLSRDYNVIHESLEDGQVSGEADMLLLVAPRGLSEPALFAVDQFLMRGGTVLLASSGFDVQFNRQALSAQPAASGLEHWLQAMGLTLAPELVLDPQNSAMPIPVTREVSGFRFQEIRLLDYPYFIQARREQLAEHPITAELPALTLHWSAPIEVDEQALAGRTMTPLVHSSAGAWRSQRQDIMPRIDRDGISAFSPEGPRGSQLLAVMMQGRFDSWFRDRAVPALSEEGAEAAPPSAVIRRSPESARLILIGSSDFLRDDVLTLERSLSGAANLSGLQLVANAVDWSLEDSGLMSIRARGHFNRTLRPLPQTQQRLWEYGNYALAALSLLLLYWLRRLHEQRRARRYLAIYASGEGQA